MDGNRTDQGVRHGENLVQKGKKWSWLNAAVNNLKRTKVSRGRASVAMPRKTVPKAKAFRQIKN